MYTLAFSLIKQQKYQTFYLLLFHLTKTGVIPPVHCTRLNTDHLFGSFKIPFPSIQQPTTMHRIFIFVFFLSTASASIFFLGKSKAKETTTSHPIQVRENNDETNDERTGHRPYGPWIEINQTPAPTHKPTYVNAGSHYTHPPQTHVQKEPGLITMTWTLITFPITISWRLLTFPIRVLYSIVTYFFGV